MKKIILCADDYGQSAAISAGIVKLVAQDRLSAVSCLSEGNFWLSADNTLLTYRDRIDIGLHFNLTHAFPAQAIAARPLAAILRTTLSGRCDRNAIATALHTQLDRFESIAGQAPDFVDGHQHVHVLPGIRSVVIAELARRYPHTKPYLRAVNPHLPGHGGFIKLTLLKLLGLGFSEFAHRYGMQTNRGFAGIYSLQPQANFGALMRNWIAAARSGDLLMCHPGCADNNISDPIAATRPHELALLQSAEFSALLDRNNVRLSRFRDL